MEEEHNKNTLNSYTVNIDEETDLNDAPQPDTNLKDRLSHVGQWDSGTEPPLPHIPADLYATLPALLKDGCNVLATPTEKDVFLVGALGVLSGIMPNVHGFYDGDFVGPNLYVYVLASYGVGKGGLKYAQRLGQAIHHEMREQADLERETYEELKAQYDKDLAAYKKDKTGKQKLPVAPAPPKNRMLFIPANNSKTGYFQLLAENGGRGQLFETEADTLADALGQDYGNFSSGLRNAFHHEKVSYYRRGNGGELVEIENPALSVVLSSTFDQLTNLMQSAQNGLFSRFLYYNLPADPTFRNVFDRQKRAYAETFDRLGATCAKMHQQLSVRQKPIEVEVSASQIERFMGRFSDLKRSIYEEHDATLGGSANRLGLICFRLCMVLTVARAFEDGEEPADTLTCSDEDFTTAITLIDILVAHALSVYYQLPQPQLNPGVDDAADVERAEQKRLCRALKADGFSLRAISQQVFGVPTKQQTVARYLSKKVG